MQRGTPPLSLPLARKHRPPLGSRFRQIPSDERLRGIDSLPLTHRPPRPPPLKRSLISQFPIPAASFSFTEGKFLFNRGQLQLSIINNPLQNFRNENLLPYYKTEAKSSTTKPKSKHGSIPTIIRGIKFLYITY